MGTQPSAVSTFVVGAFGALAGLGLGALLWSGGGAAQEPAWGVGASPVHDQSVLEALREQTRLLREAGGRPSQESASRAGDPGDAPTSADVEPLDLTALEQAERVSAAFGAHVDRLAELLAASPATSLYRVAEPTPEQRAETLAEVVARYDWSRDSGSPRPDGRSWFGASTSDLRASLGTPSNVWPREDGRITWQYVHEADGATHVVYFQFLDGYITGVNADPVR